MEKKKKKWVLLLVLSFVLVMLFLGMFTLVNSSLFIDNNLFDLNMIVLNVLLEENSSFFTTLDVESLNSETLSVFTSITDLDEIFVVYPASFSLLSGEIETLDLVFNVSKKGIFVGELVFSTDIYEKRLPVIVEVESPEHTFDLQIKLNTYNPEINAGDDVLFSVSFYDFEDLSMSKILNLNYVFLDLSGNLIYKDTQNVIINGKSTWVKTINIPDNLKEGNYILAVVGESDGVVAVSHSFFKVNDKEIIDSFSAFCGISNYFSFLPGIILGCNQIFGSFSNGIIDVAKLSVSKVVFLLDFLFNLLFLDANPKDVPVLFEKLLYRTAKGFS